jgi:subtilase family serine protease
MNISISTLFYAFALLVFTNLHSFAQDVVVPYSGTLKVKMCDGNVTDYSKNSGYSSNAFGVLVIESGIKNSYVKLSFESFELNGYRDYLDIYKGDGTVVDSMIGFFSSTNKPTFIYSTGSGKITLRFRSDSYPSGKGFKAQVSCVSQLPDVDLSLTSFASTATSVVAGSSFQTNFSISNNSHINLKNHDVSFFLSSDSVYDSSDVLLSTNTIGSLDLYASYSSSYSLAIPSSITQSGKYYVLAYYNFMKLVPELDKGNNIKSIPIEVIGSNIDLSIINTNVINYPTNKLPMGRTVQVQANVLNLGTTNAPSCNLAVYFSKDKLFDTTDIEIGRSNDNTVAASGVTSFNFSINFLNQNVEGEYYLLFIIDSKSKVVEYDEFNNTKVLPITLEQVKIDLTIDNVKLSSIKVTAGTSLTITSKIRNSGNVAANSHNCAYYFSNDTIYDLNDKLLFSTSIYSINQNTSQEIINTITIDQTTIAGKYYVIVFEDNLNTINENNEKNNYRYVELTVDSRIADVFIKNAYLSKTRLVKSSSFDVNYVMKNNGNYNLSGFYSNVYFSKDSIFDNLDVLVSDDYITINGNSDLSISSSVSIPSVTNNGDYYILIYADKNNVIVETNEKNNVLALKLKVEDPINDIQLTTLNLDKLEFVSKGKMNTFYTIENSGNIDFYYGTSIGFYYSKDSIWDNSDGLITTFNQNNLMSEMSYFVNNVVSLPSLTNGKYYLILKADYQNSITESNENNNIIATPFTVVNPIYDFEVESLDTIFKQYTSGGKYQVQLKINNKGNSTSSPLNVGFYLSTDSIWSASYQLVGNTSTNAQIDEGSNIVVNYSFNLPSNLTVGEYYVFYRVDYQDKINESNENNNTSFQKIGIISSEFDLYISNTTLGNKSVAIGTSLAMSCKLNNKGNAPVSSVKVGYYISSDSIFNKSAIFVFNSVVTQVQNNADYTLNNSMTISSLLTPGKYYVIIYADYDQLINETNEINNYVSIPIEIKPATIDLKLSNPIVSATSIVKGNSLQSNSLITNYGTITSPSNVIGYYLSLDTIFDNSDKLITTSVVSSLAENANSNITGSLTILSTINSGDYYLLSVADHLNQIIETDEKNNVVFVPLKVLNQTIDLSINQPRISTNQLVKGTTYSLNFALNSVSNSTISTAVVSFYFSKDTLIDINDVQLLDFTLSSVKPMVSTSVSYNFTTPNSLLEGKYYLLVVADKDNKLDETNEKNNTSYIEVNIENPIVDLFVSSLTTTSSSIIAGSSFVVNFSVFNNGNSTSKNTDVGIYLSNDSIFDSNDLFIKGSYIPSINSNSVYNSSDYLQTSSSLKPNDYFIILVCDYLKAQSEKNENNNIYAKKINISAPQIDLITTNLYASPTKLNPGNTINISSYINNVGQSTSSTAKLAYYLSVNNQLESSDLLLARKDYLALSSYNSFSNSSTATIPANLSPGNYYILAVADYDNSEMETNELNNVSSVLIEIGSSLTDLSPSTPIANSQANTGSSISITSNGQNNSSIVASSVKMSFFLSTNSILDNGDYLLDAQSKGVLSGGQYHSFKSTVVIPKQISSGIYYILAVVDYDNVVIESNENNNLSFTTISITKSISDKKEPDLQVSNANVSVNIVEPGQGVDLSCLITNFGDTIASASSVGYYLSDDNQFDDSDILISYTNGLKLNALVSELRYSKNVFIPKSTEIGDYYILFFVDDLNEVNEFTETNNIMSVPLKVVEETMNLNMSALSELIRVYPNPTSDNFSISIPIELDDVSVELVSLTGEMLMKKTFEKSSLINNHEFTMQDYNQGVYMLRVTTKEGTFSSSIMKFNN